MRSLKAQHKKPRRQDRKNFRFPSIIPSGLTLQSNLIRPWESVENKEKMIINIIYKSDHCIADIPYQLGHLLAFFAVHRCSWDDRLSACYFGGLCLCIIYPISGFDVRLRCKISSSIIILLLFFRCIFILSGVSGIIIRTISFCCGCCMIF